MFFLIFAISDVYFPAVYFGTFKPPSSQLFVLEIAYFLAITFNHLFLFL